MLFDRGMDLLLIHADFGDRGMGHPDLEELVASEGAQVHHGPRRRRGQVRVHVEPWMLLFFPCFSLLDAGRMPKWFMQPIYHMLFMELMLVA